MSAALHRSKLAASLRALSNATSLDAVCPAAAAAVVAAADTSVSPVQATPQPTGGLPAAAAAQQQCTASVGVDRVTGAPGLGITAKEDRGPELDSGDRTAAPVAVAALEEAGLPTGDFDVTERCAHLLGAVKQAAAVAAGGDSEGAAAAVAALRLLQTIPVTPSLLKSTGATSAAPSCRDCISLPGIETSLLLTCCTAPYQRLRTSPWSRLPL